MEAKEPDQRHSEFLVLKAMIIFILVLVAKLFDQWKALGLMWFDRYDNTKIKSKVIMKKSGRCIATESYDIQRIGHVFS